MVGVGENYSDYSLVGSVDNVFSEIESSEDFFGCDDDEDIEFPRTCVKRRFVDVLKEWVCGPANLGLPQSTLTDFCRLMHKHRPLLSEQDYKSIPQTGRGLVYVSKKHFDNIIFREMEDYRPEDDEFVGTGAYFVPMKKKDEGISEDAVASAAELAVVVEDEEPPIDLVGGRDETESDIDDDDVGDDDDIYEASGSSDDEQQPQPAPGKITVSAVSNDDYETGVNEQIAADKAKIMVSGSMTYFGIENVLLGRNPGVLDNRGLRKALKAIAILKEKALSDNFVKILFGDCLYKVCYLT